MSIIRFISGVFVSFLILYRCDASVVRVDLTGKSNGYPTDLTLFSNKQYLVDKGTVKSPFLHIVYYGTGTTDTSISVPVPQKISVQCAVGRTKYNVRDIIDHRVLLTYTLDSLYPEPSWHVDSVTGEDGLKYNIIGNDVAFTVYTAKEALDAMQGRWKDSTNWKTVNSTQTHVTLYGAPGNSGPGMDCSGIGTDFITASYTIPAGTADWTYIGPVLFVLADYLNLSDAEIELSYGYTSMSPYSSWSGTESSGKKWQLTLPYFTPDTVLTPGDTAANGNIITYWGTPSVPLPELIPHDLTVRRDELVNPNWSATIADLPNSAGNNGTLTLNVATDPGCEWIGDDLTVGSPDGPKLLADTPTFQLDKLGDSLRVYSTGHGVLHPGCHAAVNFLYKPD